MTGTKQNIKKHTIEDVAKHANVSTATVSRTLQKPELVSEKTRERVQRAVGELNYVQNTAAQMLRTARTNTIAILLPDLGNAFFSAIIRGLEREASKENYNILITPTQDDIPADDIYRKYVTHNLVDGIITLTGELPIPQEYLDTEVSSETLPPIVMACEGLIEAIHPPHIIPIKESISMVRIDNFQAAKTATEHLLNMGHTSILHIVGQAKSTLTDDRIAGFCHAMKNSGIKNPHDYIIYSDSFTPRDGEHLLNQVQNHPMKPTAIFCASDDIAMNFMTACRRHNINLPHEYSVVGFDDIRVAQHLYPALTTIHQPREDIGIVAMRTLIEKIKNPNTPVQNIVLDTNLIKRDSVAQKHQ